MDHFPRAAPLPRMLIDLVAAHREREGPRSTQGSPVHVRERRLELIAALDRARDLARSRADAHLRGQHDEHPADPGRGLRVGESGPTHPAIAASVARWLDASVQLPTAAEDAPPPPLAAPRSP